MVSLVALREITHEGETAVENYDCDDLEPYLACTKSLLQASNRHHLA